MISRKIRNLGKINLGIGILEVRGYMGKVGLVWRNLRLMMIWKISLISMEVIPM